MTVYTDKKTFLKMINKLRLENKNKWIFVNAIVDNKEVKIKAFNTWMQIFKINNIDYSNVMEQSVTDYKKHILDSIERG